MYLCECEVNSVGEWGNDQPPVETHVLIAKAEFAGALLHHDGVGLQLPVEPQLALPLKLTGLHDAVCVCARAYVCVCVHVCVCVCVCACVCVYA